MTITLEISPEVQAELSRQAAANGRRLEAYAATVLEGALHLPSTASDPAGRTLGARLVEACAQVWGLTDGVDFSRDRSTTWRPLDLS